MEINVSNTFLNGTELRAHDKTQWYGSLIGKLMYVTRPDLAYTVSTLGQHTVAPNSAHIAAPKRVLRYLQYTRNHGLRFGESVSIGSDIQVGSGIGTGFGTLELIGYSDSDWGSDPSTRKSASGFVFILAGAGSLKNREL